VVEEIWVCRTACTDPYHNLALEQYLLENVPPKVCILYLWQNYRTVVIGRNQNALRECRITQLEADGGFLARRLSGGGAVFHDLGNLNFTFLMNKPDYDLLKQLNVIVEACYALGIPVKCSGRNDVLLDSRKFSGNAFYEHHGKSYHHGTLLVDVDMRDMERYLSPSVAKMEAKGVKSVRSRVVNLREAKSDLSIDELAVQMENAFCKVYGLTAKRLEESGFDSSRISALCQRYGSWEWLRGRDLPCTMQCGEHFPWGEFELRLFVSQGYIQQVTVYTDAMDWSLPSELKRALLGRRLRLDELQNRLRTSVLEERVKDNICELLARQDL